MKATVCTVFQKQLSCDIALPVAGTEGAIRLGAIHEHFQPNLGAGSNLSRFE
jgi:hypothetical protein